MKVIPFKSCPVNILWSPKKGVNAAWRIGSTPAVVPFKAKPLQKTAATPAATINKDLVRDIEREIESIVDDYDRSFTDNVANYDYIIGDAEPDEIIKHFCDNYSVPYIDDESLDSGTEVIQEFLKLGLTMEQICKILIDSSEIQDCDIYRQNNEIYSFNIGEHEYQIDVDDHPSLKTLINQATDADLKYCGATRTYFCSYGRPCERIVWTVDINIVLDTLDTYKNKKGA